MRKNRSTMRYAIEKLEYIEECPTNYLKYFLDAVLYTNSTERLTTLINLGLYINGNMVTGGLHVIKYAVVYCNVEILKILLESGAEFTNDSIGYDYNPIYTLMLATEYQMDGPIDKIKMLIAAGADINYRDNRGRTCWDTANTFIKKQVPELNPNAYSYSNF